MLNPGALSGQELPPVWQEGLEQSLEQHRCKELLQAHQSHSQSCFTASCRLHECLEAWQHLAA